MRQKYVSIHPWLIAVRARTVFSFKTAKVGVMTLSRCSNPSRTPLLSSSTHRKAPLAGSAALTTHSFPNRAHRVQGKPPSHLRFRLRQKSHAVRSFPLQLLREDAITKSWRRGNADLLEVETPEASNQWEQGVGVHARPCQRRSRSRDCKAPLRSP